MKKPSPITKYRFTYANGVTEIVKVGNYEKMWKTVEDAKGFVKALGVTIKSIDKL